MMVLFIGKRLPVLQIHPDVFTGGRQRSRTGCRMAHEGGVSGSRWVCGGWGGPARPPCSVLPVCTCSDLHEKQLQVPLDVFIVFFLLC